MARAPMYGRHGPRQFPVLPPSPCTGASSQGRAARFAMEPHANGRLTWWPVLRTFTELAIACRQAGRRSSAGVGAPVSIPMYPKPYLTPYARPSARRVPFCPPNPNLVRFEHSAATTGRQPPGSPPRPARGAVGAGGRTRLGSSAVRDKVCLGDRTDSLIRGCESLWTSAISVARPCVRALSRPPTGQPPCASCSAPGRVATGWSRGARYVGRTGRTGGRTGRSALGFLADYCACLR